MAKPVPVYSVASAASGFEVHADNAALKTPKGAALAVPTHALADAVVSEWRAQPEKINRAAMPLTQLAATALDIVAKERVRITDQLVNFIGSELICHYAEQPDELVKRQHAAWQPLLDWCKQKYGAALNTGSGIMPIAQTPEATQAIRYAVDAYDDFRLTGLRQAADICGSLVLALALAEKRLTAEQVCAAAELDAAFQMEKWGEDPAIIQRHKDALKELEICQEWFLLLK